MKIAVTGHRPNKLQNDYDLKGLLVEHIRAKIIELIKKEVNDSPVELITGMALGIDTLFAKIAIECGLPFTAAIPFKGQENRWIDKSVHTYYELLNMASKIVVVSTGNVYTNLKDFAEKEPLGVFSGAAMQKRNEWMVDNCDVLIAVWNGSSGGTKNCVDYAYHAYHNTKQIYVINPNDIEREIIGTEI